MCLTATADAKNIFMEQCDSEDEAQKWRYNSDTKQVQNSRDNDCMHLALSSGESYLNAWLEPCDKNKEEQKFDFPRNFWENQNDQADLFCDSGIKSADGLYCCPASCGGVCGGSTCWEQDGGAGNCCTGNIQETERDCATQGPPCKMRDPTCETGVLSDDGTTCCSDQCGGKCGGDGCNLREGGRSNCCISTIQESFVSCMEFGPPCRMVEGYTLPETAELTKPKVYKFYVYGDFNVLKSDYRIPVLQSDDRMFFSAPIVTIDWAIGGYASASSANGKVKGLKYTGNEMLWEVFAQTEQDLSSNIVLFKNVHYGCYLKDHYNGDRLDCVEDWSLGNDLKWNLNDAMTSGTSYRRRYIKLRSLGSSKCAKHSENKFEDDLIRMNDCDTLQSTIEISVMFGTWRDAMQGEPTLVKLSDGDSTVIRKHALYSDIPLLRNDLLYQHTENLPIVAVRTFSGQYITNNGSSDIDGDSTYKGDEMLWKLEYLVDENGRYYNIRSMKNNCRLSSYNEEYLTCPVSHGATAVDFLDAMKFDLEKKAVYSDTFGAVRRLTYAIMLSLYTDKWTWVESSYFVDKIWFKDEAKIAGDVQFHVFYGEYSDPDKFCDTGIESPDGQICCSKSCGSCGGMTCDENPGGFEHCCLDIIEHSGRSCDTHSPPCVIQPDPTCETGILSSNDLYCCSDSCGTCGGTDCGLFDGGPDECCTGRIENSERYCDTHAPPCIMPDPNCETGVLSPNGLYCCSKSCGDQCGGSGCAQLDGGSDQCCTGGIEESERYCDIHSPPCMLRPDP